VTEQFDLYIGTYTRSMPHVDGKADGLYLYHFDASSGELTDSGQVINVVNPTYIAIDATRRYLYTVEETGEDDSIHVFAIESTSGGLTPINQQSARGRAPCHLNIDNTGQYLVVANYVSGNVAVFPLNADGSLGEATDVVRHHGQSVNAARQEAAHTHAVVFDNHNRVYIPDLGIDKIMIYQLDVESGKLRPNQPGFADLQAGAGPRHLAFHPNGAYAFVLNELDSTLVTFTVDGDSGGLTHLQTTSTLPDIFKGENYCAAIRLSADGRFIYASNRGHDSIAIFSFDAQSGAVTRIGHESTQGEYPRDFNIDPTGQFLLVANQNTDTVTVFRIHQHTGLLQETGLRYTIPTPVCLYFNRR